MAKMAPATITLTAQLESRSIASQSIDTESGRVGARGRSHSVTLLALQGLGSRWVFVSVQSILVVVAGVHYMSDCVVAVLAVLYIEMSDINVGEFVSNGIPSASYSCTYLKRVCKRKAHRMSDKARVYERVSQRERNSGGKTPATAADVPDEYGITTP